MLWDFINMTGFASLEETGIRYPNVEGKISSPVCHWSHLCRTSSPLLKGKMWRKSLIDWHKDFNQELPLPRDLWAWGKLFGLWLSCNISEIASLLKMETEASDGLQVGRNLKVKNTAYIWSAYKMTVTKEKVLRRPKLKLRNFVLNYLHAATSTHLYKEMKEFLWCSLQNPILSHSCRNKANLPPVITCHMLLSTWQKYYLLVLLDLLLWSFCDQLN